MPSIDFKHYGLLLAYAVLTAIINLVFSKRSQIDEWCEANPALAAVAKFCRGFGVDPWTIAQSLVLLFTSKLPGYQKQSLAQLNSKKPPSGMGPMGGVLALCLCLTLTCCAFFKSAVWPVVEKCAPSARTLVAQVESVLLAGGDYESTLKQIAETDGEAAVVCAVKEAVSELGSKIGASESSAAARGHAFLAKTGNAK